MKNNYYSNIYWHFTGSPENIKWEKKFKPKDITERPKSFKKSFAILCSIVKDGKLKATSKEILDIKNKTEGFCCLTDIPLFDLKNHTKHYGKVAIGFYPKKVHKLFNPVLYIPKEHFFKYAFSTINPYSGKSTFLRYHHIKNENIHQFFLNYLKFTDFSDKPDGSFYQEREWRKIGDFEFNREDIAAIIIPEAYRSKIQKFLEEDSIRNKMNITLLTWEFLEK